MRRVVAFALFLAIAVGQTSCMTAPRPIASPRTYIPLRKPDRVWLTNLEGERYMVLRPRALGDSLFGRTAGGDEVWIAFSDARRIEARQFDRTKTYAVIGGSIVMTVFAIVLLSSSGTGLSPDQFPTEEPHLIGR